MENQKDNTWKPKTFAKTKFQTGDVSHLPGKMPPQALEIEEAVLGALMLDNQAVGDVLDILIPESFYKKEHELIFKVIRDLFTNSQPIDMLTVVAELRKQDLLNAVGGPIIITNLTSRVSSSAHIEYHARLVSQMYTKRQLISFARLINDAAFDETNDVFDLLDKAEQSLFDITESNLKSNTEKISELLAQATQQLEELRKNEGKLSGVPSGFTDLDRLTGGFQNSDLIIMAARPGMGKTAFVMSLARNAAVDFDKPVAVFSLEMSSVQLVMRLISSESEIEGDSLRKGNLVDYQWTQLHKRTEKLSRAPIFIDDTPALSTFDLRAKCRRLKANNNISMVIIDYLQLMSGGKEGNREQQISAISRSLKALAKELQIPVIALSQLSRQVEMRSATSKRPMLSDLRESGSIEQDADQVMFIYRPEYYGLDVDENNQSTEGLAEIIIAKNRHGSTQTVNLYYEKKFARFQNSDSNGFYAAAGSSSHQLEDNNSGFKAAITRKSRMNDENDVSASDSAPF